MKSLLHRLAWASAGVAVACGLASRATANDAAPAPCPEPCPPARVVCAQAPKVIVEVPPPNVIIRAAAAPCATAPRETLLQKICHFGCHQHHPHHHHQFVQQAFVQPMAVQQFAVQQFAVQPMAVQHFVAPQAAPQFMVAPQAAPQFAVAPQAAPQMLTFQLAVAPQAPAATPPVAPAATPANTGETCDAALRRITSQMETLTKVVETHTLVLTSHEDRIKRLEDWAANAKTQVPAIPALPALPKLP